MLAAPKAKTPPISHTMGCDLRRNCLDSESMSEIQTSKCNSSQYSHDCLVVRKINNKLLHRHLGHPNKDVLSSLSHILKPCNDSASINENPTIGSTCQYGKKSCFAFQSC